MALTFNGSSSKLVGENIVADFPFTLFCWVRPSANELTADNAAIGLGDFGASSEAAIMAVGSLAGDPIRAFSRTTVGSSSSAFSATSIAVDTWHPAMAVFSASNSRIIYYADGAAVTESTVRNLDFANYDRTVIGCRPISDTLFWGGDIAHAAIWARALDADDWTALQGGAAPSDLHYADLLDYWVLESDAATQTGVKGTVLTATDTATAGTSPPVGAGTPVSFTGTVPTLNGTESVAFSESLASYFSGSETPFTYSLQAGTLPAGLTLNTSTGAISGTPTTPGASSGIVIRATDATPNTADTNSFDIVIAGADVTAPTLTDPAGTATGQNTASGAVTTDEANGTLYAVVTASATPPSAADIRAGTGAVYATSQAVSATGVQNVAATGLTADTLYYWHFLHDDAASNPSSVVTSASFTTDAAASNNIRLQFAVRREAGALLGVVAGLFYEVMSDDRSTVVQYGTLTTDANGQATIDINASPWVVGDYVRVNLVEYAAATPPQDRLVKAMVGFVPAIAQP